jgi:hypothetical protein
MLEVADAVPPRLVVPPERQHHQIGEKTKALRFQEAPALKKAVPGDSGVDAFDPGFRESESKGSFHFLHEAFVMEQARAESA